MRVVFFTVEKAISCDTNNSCVEKQKAALGQAKLFDPAET